MTTGPILIVDDDPQLREALVTALELQGYRTQVARDGHEALRAVERERPALVLLDCHMPELDGRGFVRELRTRRLDLPLVVMSIPDEASRFAAQSGAAAYLEKPFGIPRLLDAIAACQGPAVTSEDAGRAAA